MTTAGGGMEELLASKDRQIQDLQRVMDEAERRNHVIITSLENSQIFGAQELQEERARNADLLKRLAELQKAASESPTPQQIEEREKELVKQLEEKHKLEMDQFRSERKKWRDKLQDFQNRNDDLQVHLDQLLLSIQSMKERNKDVIRNVHANETQLEVELAAERRRTFSLEKELETLRSSSSSSSSAPSPVQTPAPVPIVSVPSQADQEEKRALELQNRKVKQENEELKDLNRQLQLRIDNNEFQLQQLQQQLQFVHNDHSGLQSRFLQQQQLCQQQEAELVAARSKALQLQQKQLELQEKLDGETRNSLLLHHQLQAERSFTDSLQLQFNQLQQAQTEAIGREETPKETVHVVEDSSQLSRELERAQFEIKTLQNELDLQRQLAERQTTQLNSSISELRSQLERSEKSAAFHLQTIEEMQRQLTQQTNTLKKRADDNTALSAQIQALETRLSSLQGDHENGAKQFEMKQQVSQRQFDDLRQQFDLEKQLNGQLQGQIQQLQELLRSTQANSDELLKTQSDQFNDLLNQFIQLKQSAQQQKLTIEQQIEEISRKDSSIQDLQQQLSKAQHLSTSLLSSSSSSSSSSSPSSSSEIREDQTKNAALINQRLSSELESLQVLHKNSMEVVQQLSTQLKETRTASFKLESQVAELTSQLSLQENRLLAHQSSSLRRDQEAANLKEEISQLEKQLAVLQADLDRERQRSQTLARENQSSERSLSETQQGDLQNLQKKIDELSNRIQQQTFQINALQLDNQSLTHQADQKDRQIADLRSANKSQIDLLTSQLQERDLNLHNTTQKLQSLQLQQKLNHDIASSLEEQMRSVSAENARLSAQLSSVPPTPVAESQSVIEMLKTTIAEQTTEMKRIHQKLMEAQERETKLLQTIDQIRQNSQQEINLLQDSLLFLKTNYTQSQLDLENSQTQYEALKKTISGTDDRLQLLQSQLETQTKLNQQLSQARLLSRSSSQSEALAIPSSSSSSSSSSLPLASQDAHLSVLEENRQLQAEISQLKQRVQQEQIHAQSQQSLLQTQITHYQATVEKQAQEIATWMSEYDKLSTQMTQVQQKAVKLETDLQSAAQQHRAQLDSQREQFGKQIENLESQKQDLLSNVQKTQQQNQQLSASLQQTTESVSSLRNNLLDAHKQHQQEKLEVDLQIQRISAENLQLHSLIQSTSAENLHLKSVVSQLEASRSASIDQPASSEDAQIVALREELDHERTQHRLAVKALESESISVRNLRSEVKKLQQSPAPLVEPQGAPIVFDQREEASRSEIQRLLEERSELQTTIEKLRNEQRSLILQRESESTTNRIELERITSDRLLVQRELQVAQQQILQLTNQISSLLIESASFNPSLASSSSSLAPAASSQNEESEISRDLRDERDENERLKQLLQNAEDERRRLLQTISLLETECSQTDFLRSQLSERDKQVLSHQTLNDQLEADRSSLRSAIDLLQSQLVSAETELAKTRLQAQHWQTMSVEQQQKLADLSSNYSAKTGQLTQQIAFERQTSLQLQTQLEDANHSLSLLRKEYSSLQTRIDSLVSTPPRPERPEATSLASPSSVVSQQAYSLVITELKRERALCQEAFEQLQFFQTELLTAQQALSVEKQLIDTQDASINEMQREIDSLKMNLQQCAVRSGPLESQLVQLRQTIDQREQTIQQLLAERSIYQTKLQNMDELANDLQLMDEQLQQKQAEFQRFYQDQCRVLAAHYERQMGQQTEEMKETHKRELQAMEENSVAFQKNLSQQLDRLQQQLAQQTQANQQLQEHSRYSQQLISQQDQSRQQELQQTRDANRQLEFDLRMRIQQVSQLEQQNQYLAQESSKFQKRFEAVVADHNTNISRLLAENQELKSKSDRLHHELEGCQRMLQQAEIMKKNLEDQILYNRQLQDTEVEITQLESKESQHAQQLLQAERDRLINELQGLRQQQASLIQQEQSLESFAHLKGQELAQAMEKLHEHQQSHDEILISYVQLHQQHQRLQEQSASTQRDLEEALIIIALLQQNSENSANEINEKASRSDSDLKAQIQELQSRLQQLQSSHHSDRSVLMRLLTEERSNHQNTKSLLDDHLQNEAKKNKQMEDFQRQIESIVQEANTSLSVVLPPPREDQDRLKWISDQLVKERERNSGLQVQLRAMEQNSQQIAARAKETESNVTMENARLQQQIQQLHQHVDQLSQKQREEHQQLNQVVKLYESIQTKNSDLQAQLDQRSAAYEQLYQQYQAVYQQAELRGTSVAQREQEIAKIQQDREKVQAGQQSDLRRIEELSLQNGQFQKQIHYLQQQVDLLQQQLSTTNEMFEMTQALNSQLIDQHSSSPSPTASAPPVSSFSFKADPRIYDELQKEISQLRLQNQHVVSQLQSSSEAQMQLQQQIENLKRSPPPSIENAKRQVELENQALTQQIHQLHQQNLLDQQQIHRLTIDLQSLEKDLQRKNESNEHLRQSLQETLKSRSDVPNEIQHLQQQLLTAQQQIHSEQKVRAVLKEQMDQQQAQNRTECSRLQLHIQRLEKQLLLLRQQIQDDAKRHQAMLVATTSSHLKGLRSPSKVAPEGSASVDDAPATHDGHEESENAQQVRELAEKVQALLKEQVDLKVELEETKHQRDLQIDESKEWAQRHRSVQSQFDQQLMVVQQLQQQISLLNQQAHHLQSDLAASQQNLESTKKRLATAQQLEAHHRADLEETKKRHQQNVQDIRSEFQRQLTERHRTFSVQLKSMEEQLKAKNDLIQHHQSLHQQALEEVSQMNQFVDRLLFSLQTNRQMTTQILQRLSQFFIHTSRFIESSISSPSTSSPSLSQEKDIISAITELIGPDSEVAQLVKQMQDAEESLSNSSHSQRHYFSSKNSKVLASQLASFGSAVQAFSSKWERWQLHLQKVSTKQQIDAADLSLLNDQLKVQLEQSQELCDRLQKQVDLHRSSTEQLELKQRDFSEQSHVLKGVESCLLSQLNEKREEHRQTLAEVQAERESRRALEEHLLHLQEKLQMYENQMKQMYHILDSTQQTIVTDTEQQLSLDRQLCIDQQSDVRLLLSLRALVISLQFQIQNQHSVAEKERETMHHLLEETRKQFEEKQREMEKDLELSQRLVSDLKADLEKMDDQLQQSLIDRDIDREIFAAERQLLLTQITCSETFSSSQLSRF